MATLADIFSQFQLGGPQQSPEPTLRRPSLDELLGDVLRNGQEAMRDDPTSPLPTTLRGDSLVGIGRRPGGPGQPSDASEFTQAPQAPILTGWDATVRREPEPDPSEFTQAPTPQSQEPQVAAWQTTVRPEPQQAPSALGGPAALPAPTQAPERSMMSQLSTFLAGLGRGGGAVLPALGEGARAVEGSNDTARLLAARGVPTETIQAALTNPAVMQQVIATVFRPQTVKLGQGEALYTNDGRPIASNQPRDQIVPAGGTQTRDGVPVYRAPRNPREISVADLGRLRTEGALGRTYQRLGETFRDDFAVPGTVVGGDVANWYAQNAPERMTTPEARQRAQWWQDYRRNSELLERHELFGAALTPTEQASWRAATIHPNMNAATIRESLRRQNEILTTGIQNYRQSLAAAGYDEAAIDAALGQQQSTAPPVREGATATHPQTGARIIFRGGKWQPA
jgi:hypothetical protein